MTNEDAIKWVSWYKYKQANQESITTDVWLNYVQGQSILHGLRKAEESPASKQLKRSATLRAEMRERFRRF